MSFNPRYPASNYPNAVDEINFTPAEVSDAIMAIQANVLGGGSMITGNGTVAGPRMLGGAGVPATTLGAVGDYYFRSDTPATANQRIYVKTAAAVWTALTV